MCPVTATVFLDAGRAACRPAPWSGSLLRLRPAATHRVTKGRYRTKLWLSCRGAGAPPRELCHRAQMRYLGVVEILEAIISAIGLRALPKEAARPSRTRCQDCEATYLTQAYLYARLAQLAREA